MADRESLQILLETILSGQIQNDCPDVYYQPPETVLLKYPCIIYYLSKIDTDNADDVKYFKTRRYTVTYISKTPDDDAIDNILDLPFCYHDRRFVEDNLYHDVFTLYY